MSGTTPTGTKAESGKRSGSVRRALRYALFAACIVAAWQRPTMKGWWALLKDAASNWLTHKDARQGAALAYYSVFSLGPLMVIAIAIAGLVFGQDAVRGEVGSQLKGLLGDTEFPSRPEHARGGQSASAGHRGSRSGHWGPALRGRGRCNAAQGCLSTPCGRSRAPKGGGSWSFLRTYIASLAGVLAVGFLLLVSLLLTTLLSAGGKYLAPYLPEAVLQIAGSLASFGVITLLFAMMFKWLPDTPVNWRDVWLGAAITAALFEIGKVLIGLYIGKQALESAYGAAALPRGAAHMDILLVADRPHGRRGSPGFTQKDTAQPRPTLQSRTPASSRMPRKTRCELR